MKTIKTQLTILSTLFSLLIFHLFSQENLNTDFSLEEVMRNSSIYQSVNVITGDYEQAHTDLFSINDQSIKIRRYFSNSKGWSFNIPLKKQDLVFPELRHFNFEYNSDSLLQSIQAADKKTIAQLNWSHDKAFLKIDLSQTLSLQYKFKEKNPFPKSIPLIESIFIQDKELSHYEYRKHPYTQKPLLSLVKNERGVFLVNEYYDTYINQVGESFVSISDPLTDNRIGKVKLQKEPVAQNGDFVITAKYFYHPTFTEVFNAHNKKSVYHHDSKGHLTAIDEYLNDKLYRRECFLWQEHPQIKDQWLLIAKEWRDRKNKVLKSQTFDYDVYGNLIQETLYGNLSGKKEGSFSTNAKGVPLDSTIESYSLYFTYSSECPTQLLSKSEDNGKTLYYIYDTKNSLKIAELLGDKNSIWLRRFFEYNRANQIEKIILDDGKTANQNDLSGVTKKSLTVLSYSNNETLNQSPSCIEKLKYNFSSKSYISTSKALFEYDLEGKLKEKQTFLSDGTLQGKVNYDYDNLGRLIQELDSFHNGWKKSYDCAGNLTNEISFQEGTPILSLKYNYNLLNRPILIEKIDNKGSFSSEGLQYDWVGNKVASTDELGQVTAYTYDDLNRCIYVGHPKLDKEDSILSPKHPYEFDIFDNCTQEIDPKGHVKTIAYTIRGKPFKCSDSKGSSEFFFYNLDGSLQQTIDRKGVFTTYLRDILGRELSMTIFDADGNQRRSVIFSYTPFHLIKTTKDNLHTTSYEYDFEGKLILQKLIFPTGSQQIEYFYNTQRSCVKKIEASSETDLAITEYIFDNQNQLIKTIISNKDLVPLKEIENVKAPLCREAREKTTFVNSFGQYITSITNRQHNEEIKTCFYDSLKRLTSITTKNPLNEILSHTDIEYDLIGNKTKESSYDNGSLEKVNEWTYDSDNKVTEFIENSLNENSRNVRFIYNLKGQLVETLKPNGTSLFYSYNSLGQIEHYHGSDSSFDYFYQYDIYGNLIEIKDLIYHNTTERIVDSLGHILKETLGNGLTLSNIFDSKGRRTLLNLPDNSSIAFDYDPLYLRKITRLTKGGESQYFHEYSEYSLKGDILKMSMIGAAGYQFLTYDEKRRCQSIKTPCWSIEIPKEGIDFLGNIIELTTNDTHSTTIQKYTYDQKNQISSESGLFSNTYLYDFRGNRKAKNNQNYIVDALDQMNYIADNNSLNAFKESFEYSLNGNISATKKENQEVFYHYDALDRLILIEIPFDKKIACIYDAFDRRLTKTVYEWDTRTVEWTQKTKILFIYDGQKEIGCVDEKGCIKELRLLGIGSMETGESVETAAAIAHEIGDKIYAPIHDHRGNVCCLIDSVTGEVAETIYYSAFGEQCIYSPDGTSYDYSLIQNPWMFSSKRLDKETGLIFFGKRYYNQTIGRWLTKDPLGLIDGPNPYLFVHNNPLSSIDCYGLLSWSSTWDNAANWLSLALESLQNFKLKYSYEEQMYSHINKITEDTFSPGFLKFAGYFRDSIETGHSSFGHEINDHVRVTFINGILNIKTDFDDSLKLFSTTHGDTVIHYVFRPTEGWTIDIIQAICAKLGFTSCYAKALAKTWKELIQELGGTKNKGSIIHYSHSIGSADTYMAIKLLTPEEQQMIHVITIGSPSLISRDSGFASVLNYVSRRDGVCLFDPVGYLKGLFTHDSETVFLGSHFGIPLIDHTLFMTTYTGIIIDLGVEFTKKYPTSL